MPVQRPLRIEDFVPTGGDRPRRLGTVVLTPAEIDSTNTELKRRAAALPDGAIVAAEFQSSGRGRLGRAWHAPRGAGLTFSVLLHEPPASPLVRLGAMLGAVAVCETIEATTDVRPRLRWPNDVVAGGRKLAGILAETVAIPNGRAVIIGVGVNCYQQPGHFEGPLARTATSLEMESAGVIDRAALATATVLRLDTWIRRTASASGAELLAAWRRRSADVGQSVTLRQDGALFHGAILDVAESGDLVVRLCSGERRHFGAATTTRDR